MIDDDEDAPRPRDRKAAVKGWLAKGIFESGLIVFSVFLALALEHWKEESDKAQKEREAERFFAAEIRANRDVLTSPDIMPYHQRMARAWTVLADLPHPTPADENKAWAAGNRGIHPAPLKDAVWRSVSASELAQHLPARTLFALAEIYRDQADLETVNRTIYATIIAPTSEETNPNFIRSRAAGMHAFLGDVNNEESKLVGEYDQALKLLNTGDAGK